MGETAAQVFITSLSLMAVRSSVLSICEAVISQPVSCQDRQEWCLSLFV